MSHIQESCRQKLSSHVCHHVSHGLTLSLQVKDHAVALTFSHPDVTSNEDNIFIDLCTAPSLKKKLQNNQSRSIKKKTPWERKGDYVTRV